MFELSRIPASSRVAATDSDPARDLRPGAAGVPVHGGSHVSGLHHPPQCTRLDPPLCSFMKKKMFCTMYNVHILFEHWKIKCQFFIKILDKRFNLGIKIKHKKNTTMKHCILSVSICLNQDDLIVIILSYPLMRQIDSLRLSCSFTFLFKALDWEQPVMWCPHVWPASLSTSPCSPPRLRSWWACTAATSNTGWRSSPLTQWTTILNSQG